MNRQSGFGTFKALLALALFGAVIYLGLKLVPPFFHNWEFQDTIGAVARTATYAQGSTEESIRTDVVAKAKEIGVPVTEEQVTVSKANYGVNIEVNYTVPVELPGYTVKLKFNPVAGNRMITAK